jgi:hypothetical protein
MALESGNSNSALNFYIVGGLVFVIGILSVVISIDRKVSRNYGEKEGKTERIKEKKSLSDDEEDDTDIDNGYGDFASVYRAENKEASKKVGVLSG